MNKSAGHVEDRAKERTGLHPKEIRKLQAQVQDMDLEPGVTYHHEWPQRGYAVIAPAREDYPKHVVKTILAPWMHPPGIPLPMQKAADIDDYLSKAPWRMPSRTPAPMNPKKRFNWDGFREGIRDEGAPMAGLVTGTGIGHHFLPVGGKGALLGGGMGYAVGALANLGVGSAQERMEKKHANAMEVLPGAIGATLGAGVGGGLAKDEKHKARNMLAGSAIGYGVGDAVMFAKHVMKKGSAIDPDVLSAFSRTLIKESALMPSGRDMVRHGLTEAAAWAKAQGQYYGLRGLTHPAVATLGTHPEVAGAITEHIGAQGAAGLAGLAKSRALGTGAVKALKTLGSHHGAHAAHRLHNAETVGAIAAPEAVHGALHAAGHLF